MKKCTKCKIEKEVTEFSKNKTTKDGLQYNCKSCVKGRNEEWRRNNKEKIKEYRENNKEYFKEYKKGYYQNNKEYFKEWRENNEERRKEYYQNNKEKSKKYRENNKEYQKEYIKEYIKKRRKIDPLYKMSVNLRTRTWFAFKNKGYKKNTKTQEMLGVDWEVCKAHIERQFTIGMNWDNQGKWHIDHIIPLASANTEEGLIKLCHYSNLQPLWAEDNLKKSDKIGGQQNKLRL